MTDTCRFVGHDEPRVLLGRHVDDVEDHDDDCPGCQPCTAQHCIVCRVEHVENEQTCPTCVGKARERLRSVYGLHKHLASEARHGGQDGRLAAARPIPGGEATVLRGPGSLGSATAYSRKTYRLTKDELEKAVPDVSHRKDERPGEAMPTSQLLEQWADEWREKLGVEIPEHKSLKLTAKFMLEHLTWAAQRTGSFPEFVHDITKHAAVLEAILHDGERQESGAAPCFRCGGDLERSVYEIEPCEHAELAQQIAKHWKEPSFTTVHLMVYLERHYPKVARQHKKCDQGGRRDTYRCTRCHWRYDKGSYSLAVREEVERQKAAAKKAKQREAATTSTPRRRRSRAGVEIDRVLEQAENLGIQMTPWQEDFMRNHFSKQPTKGDTA